jgi:putative NIF3 family GTP cyclohydrolase 1 type 2
MKRRDFIITTGLGILSVPSSSGMSFGTKIKTAGELNAFLRNLYFIEGPSVDRIIVGDPDIIINKVGTVWMPYLSILTKALLQGVNVLIVHEPTFYTHWDLNVQDYKVQSYYNSPSPAKEQYIEFIEEKRRWIEENGLVIIRSHDVMDIIKDFGMPYALGQKLGFSNKDIIRSRNYYNVYHVEKDTAHNIAKKIAAQLKDFNQPGVAFYGDPDRLVSSVGIGAGCICDPQEFADMQPDLYLAVDDKIRAWIQGTYSEDTGTPLVVINHGAAEECGMRLLNEFLRKKLTEIEFVHFNQGCSYQWICG